MAKPKRYSKEPDFYRTKLNKVMTEFGLKPEHWELKYDRWEGACLDFTFKGITRRFERIIDKERIFYASDCLAQIALGMERLLWLKREGIFNLDTLTAGLPQLPAPLPEWVKDLGLGWIPSDMTEVERQFKIVLKECHPDVGGTNDAVIRLTKARDNAKKYFEGK